MSTEQNQNNKAPVTMKVKTILEEAPEKTKNRELLFEMEHVGMVAPEAEVEVEPEESPETKIQKAIIEAISAKLEAASPEELKKVMDILGMDDSMSVSGGNGGGEEEATTEEVNRLEQQLSDMRLENEVVRDLSKAKVDPTVQNIRAVMAQVASDRKSFIEERLASKDNDSSTLLSAPRPNYSPASYSEEHGRGESGDANKYADHDRITEARKKLAAR